jgi:hypothetical protein
LGPRWSTFLGIGPAKTGSTAVFDMLTKHQNVSMGNSYMGGLPCCGSELYFFSVEREREIYGGTKRYSLFFDKRNNLKGSAVVAGEKTPRYSYDPLAAYRAGAMLHRPVKLIFTVRDELEADMSLYMARHIATKYKADYLEWVGPRVAIFKEWMQCRQTFFSKLAIPLSDGNITYMNLRDINDPTKYTWQTAAQIESYLYKFCQQGRTPPRLAFYMEDYIQERLHAANLRRWIHVFGRENLLCIQNEDMSRHPQLVQTAVTEFLGLDQAGWSGYVPQPHLSANSSLSSKDIEMVKLRDMHMYLGSAKVIPDALRLLNDTLQAQITDEDRALVAELCPHLSNAH